MIEYLIDKIRITMWLLLVGFLWIKKYEEVEKWLNEREEDRLNREKISKFSNIKWYYIETWSVDVTVVKDRKSLLRVGRLLDWLRNLAYGRALVTLDWYVDNLCLWRCIVVYRGVKLERSIEEARIYV